MTVKLSASAKAKIDAAARDMVRLLDKKVTVERVAEKIVQAERLYVAHREQDDIWAAAWEALRDIPKWLREARSFDETNPYCMLIEQTWPGGWAAYAAATYNTEPTETLTKNKREEQITEIEAMFRGATGKKSGRGENAREALVDVWPLVVTFTERSKLHPIRKTHDQGGHSAQIVAELLGYELDDVFKVSDIKRKDKFRRAMGRYWTQAGEKF